MTMTPVRRHRWVRMGWSVLALAVLGGVFMLYTRPTFMVSMIDQLWACF